MLFIMYICLGLNKNWYIYIDARPTAPTQPLSTTTAPTAEHWFRNKIIIIIIIIMYVFVV